MNLNESFLRIKHHDFDKAPYPLVQEEADLLMPALDKALSKRPRSLSVGRISSGGVCPSCGCACVYYPTLHDEESNYCRNCGQKLDWMN